LRKSAPLRYCTFRDVDNLIQGCPNNTKEKVEIFLKISAFSFNCAIILMALSDGVFLEEQRI